MNPLRAKLYAVACYNRLSKNSIMVFKWWVSIFLTNPPCLTNNRLGYSDYILYTAASVGRGEKDVSHRAYSPPDLIATEHL